jgi:predicted AlkP superfamily phosphohydrolase/phosphomutase
MSARVLAIAFDACETDLALRWAEQGLLPNLAAMVADAMVVETRSTPGLFAGAVWPSLMTGVSAARHRCYYPRQPRLGNYADEDFGPTDLAAPPFWQELSRKGRRVAIIDVPLVPLSIGLNGVQVLDWTSHDAFYKGGRSEPAQVLADLRRRFGPLAFDHCDGVERTPAGIGAFLRGLQTRIACKAEGARTLLAREHWDLFLTVFGEAHCVGHQLFHQHEPSHRLHDKALAADLGDPLLKVYQSLDGGLGQLLAEARPQTTVCVLLSHGMGPAYFDENVIFDDVLRRIETSRGTPTSSPYAILRRQWYRLPLAWRSALRSLRGKVLPFLHRALLFPERRTRQFYAVPNNAVAGAIRINLVGRDANGQVRPEEYDSVCEELQREFLAIVDPETGEPWVRNVVRTRDRLCGPFADELPDVLIEWSRKRPMSVVASPRLGVFQVPPVTGRTGDHVNRGTFLVRGPGIARGKRAVPAETVEIAPTLAALVGVTLDDVDGEPIRECIG